MIAVVTDSASMLPPRWRDQYRVRVAPMTVILDGAAYHEGVDLDAAEFYRRLAAGAEVSTSAPSPGDLLAAYTAAVDAGATGIVSIHTGSDYSAVLDAARVAAREVGARVELVNSHTVSFPVALCVVAATETLAAGADLDGAAAAARAAASVVDSIFVVGVPDLARRGGRLGATPVPTSTTVLTLGPSGLAQHSQAADLEGALEAMSTHVRRAAAVQDLRVGVGDADRPELGERLTELIAGSPGVVEVVRYEVGPSVGAHSGPGTVGAVWAPA